jgi:hypothetical protein
MRSPIGSRSEVLKRPSVDEPETKSTMTDAAHRRRMDECARARGPVLKHPQVR